MGKTLTEIAQQLSTPKTVQKTVAEKTKVVEEVKPVPKVQLVYAFNGTGKVVGAKLVSHPCSGENA